MPKQFKFDLEAKEALLKGINLVNDAVATTLGPKGNNVAIDRQFGPPIVVHDGVTVAKEVDPEDPFENMGAQLVKEAAQKTNDAAGDGTTTATILAHAIATEAHKMVMAGSNAMMLRKGITAAVQRVVEALQASAKKLKTSAEIEQVATISAQDPQIGKLIAVAIEKLGRDAVITVEESKSTDMTVEYKEGMEFDRGFVSPHFITSPEKQEAEVGTLEEHTYVLITDKKLTNLEEFIQFINPFAQDPTKKSKNLVIIASSVDGPVLATLIINKLQGKMGLLAVQAPGYGDKQKAILEDIAAVTGGLMISEESGVKLDKVNINMLGQAKRVTSTKNSTLIVGGMGTKEEIKNRIKSIEKQMENKDISDFDLEKLQERLAKLKSGVAVINVGANSEAEMREKKERVIDAISATKAAIEEGIVPGGETALYSASFMLDRQENPVYIADRKLTNLEEKALTGSEGKLLYNNVNSIGSTSHLIPTGDEAQGYRIVQNAIKKPFQRLMENSGYNAGEMMHIINAGARGEGIDVIDGNLKDLVKAGIIDPVKVPRTALQNAASAAIMVMTTNVLITPVKEKTEQAGPGGY